MDSYVKAVLYVYPKLENLIGQIDGVVYKKALGSFSDTSPCEAQAEKILALIGVKDMLIDLKLKSDEALEKFTAEEMKYFEYKYFRRKPKSCFEGFDVSGRSYFRRQKRLLELFEKRLSHRGIGEEELKKYAEIDFFGELVRKLEKAQS